MNTINKKQNESKINMSNKNKPLLIGGLGLLGLGGIFAYFTDTETKDNKFTVGNVEIQLIEIGIKELDATGENMVYVYGYNTALKTNTSTPTLFDTIKFANIIQGQGIEKIDKSVIATAKAIQTDGTGSMTEAYAKHFKKGEVAGDQYQEFNLKLELNGGQIFQDFKTVYEKGTIVELPWNAYLAGPPNTDFNGWYDNPKFEGVGLFYITMDSDKTVYAQWEEKNISGGGDGEGDLPDVPPTPTPPPYNPEPAPNPNPTPDPSPEEPRPEGPSDSTTEAIPRPEPPIEMETPDSSL